VGLQIVGPPGADSQVIAAAGVVESSTGVATDRDGTGGR
jgi:Asp-tRNA(Asn)/Glu-tRNA(Gln) amidotransferase A subunit family amidase